jgi:bacterioferritin (cytochrome b1)
MATATQDFEARQLLKAYRKGLISDELFEAQMREVGNGSQNGNGQYKYNGKSHTTEREMIMHLLDEYRCAENFASEYLGCWNEVSDTECVKGGLRVIQRREAYHAKLLEDRLRELGGSPQCTVPTEQRTKEMGVYASKDKSDGEKLLHVADQIQDLPKVLSFITDVIDQIQEDQQSKELLRSLVQDEESSAKWLMEACQLMNGTKAAA